MKITQLHPGNQETLVSLFQSRVAVSATAPALLSAEGDLSFAELNAKSDRCARKLRALGVKAGDRVALCMGRSAEAIAAVLAILKLGAAYVPIGTDAPMARREFILHDSAACVVMCDANQIGKFLPGQAQMVTWESLALRGEDYESLDLGVNVEPQMTAWVLYTSGSSGKPKGVLGSHSGCVARIMALWDLQPLLEGERCFQHTAFTTVDSFWEIFGPLCAGHALHIIADEIIQDTEKLLPLLAQLGVQRICLVPSLLAFIVELYPKLNELLPDLKLWVVSGEPLTQDLTRRFHKAMSSAKLFNQYGMTETCADITAYLTSDPGPLAPAVFGTTPYVPIGREFHGTWAIIVDETLKPVEDGTPGELCVGGLSLCNGYQNREELMVKSFIHLEYSGSDMRLLRTGDRAVRLSDGNLVLLGRIDSQLNLRGYRVEPGEVEVTIALHEDVKEAAVVIHETDEFRKSLVAFVTLRQPFDENTCAEKVAALHAHVGLLLAPYMRPSAFIVVEELPRTSSGKINRKDLRVPKTQMLPDLAYVEPVGPTQILVAQAFSEVLGLQKIGATDHFLEAGGNSLLAMRVVSLLRKKLQVELPLSAIFEAPTVSELATQIEKGQSLAVACATPILRSGNRAAGLPMSFTQERLWFLDRLGISGTAYTISWHLSMAGVLDEASLVRALSTIVERHEILRTRFEEKDGEGLQIISSYQPLTLASRSVPAGTLNSALAGAADWSFDLYRGPLYHFELLNTAAEENHLIVALHHIICDGWSMDVFARELCALYAAFTRGEPSPLVPLPVQFADYALWQREWLEGEVTTQQLAYWREQLKGAPAALELPTDHVRPAVASYRGGHVELKLSVKVTQELKAFAQREGVTLYMVLLGALQVLLARWSGQNDVVVGSPIAGRMEEQTEHMIGFFANTVALRTRLDGDPSFRELLKRVRQTALGAYANQDLPFEKLVEDLQPARDLSRQAIFQVMFALHPPVFAATMPSLVVQASEGRPSTAKFDLALELFDAPDGLVGTLEYATDLWLGETAERFARHLSTILESIVRTPERSLSTLKIIESAELDTLLRSGSDFDTPYPHDQSIAALFEAQVAKTPDAMALHVNGQELTYFELDRRAGLLAAHLQRLGASPDSVVALLVDRSVEMIVGLLGILKAGSAYLPLDVGYPVERIEYMLADADVPIVVTQERLSPMLSECKAKYVMLDLEWPKIAAGAPMSPRHLDSQQLAYVIYTSGSTGRPKGVMISHYSILNHLAWMQKTHQLATDDRVLQNASISFDVSVWQLFWPLLNGAGLVVTPPDGHRDMHYIVDLVERVGVTVMHMVPSMLQAFVETVKPGRCTTVRDFIVGGEALSATLQNRFIQDFGCTLHNQYGPTETAVEVSAHVCAPLPTNAIVPIGRPLSNTQLYVLDSHSNLCPIGVAGELYIAGVGLARGYLKRAALTAERFVPNPFSSGERMYKTGDLVRWNTFGALEYLGRIDHQVKIRGFRIETGEIEAALLEHAAVRQAIVIACEDQAGHLQLVGYVVGVGVDEHLLKTHLRSLVPEHMVPSVLVALEEMPLTPNGKVDRKALPIPDLAVSRRPYVAPRTHQERELSNIIARILKCERVGLNDDFFELGGHSLLAMRLVAQIRDSMGFDIPLRDLFDGPTVAQLASCLAKHEVTAVSRKPLRANPRSIDAAVPLSFSQERLWFLNKLGVAGIAYNVPWILQLKGELDVQALEQAIGEIVSRHEVLRGRFIEIGSKTVQLIDPPHSLVLDVQHVDALQLDERLQALAERQFDLKTGPLYHFTLLQSGPFSAQLSFVAHHIVCDGWSIDIFARELCTLYAAFTRGEPSPLVPLPVQFADYALWQREWLEGEVTTQQLAYWREQLKGAPAALELPTDHVRPAVASYRGGHVELKLSANVTQALKAFAQREGVTLYMVLLGALQVVLARWSGQNDVVVGSPIAGRMEEQTEHMIGFFANTVALRTRLDGDPSFRELLKRVRQTALDAYANQDLPFEKLVEDLQPARDLSRQAIFQVMFALHTMDQQLSMPGLELEGREGRTYTAKFDLNLELTDFGGSITGHLEYAADLWDAPTITRMRDHLSNVLEAVVQDPQQCLSTLPMLTNLEIEQLRNWNATDVSYPAHTLHSLIEQQVELHSDEIAVVFEGRSLSYGDLNSQANTLALRLRALGVEPDALVAVFLERSIELVVVLLGILKAGGAYVPLDTSQPLERLDAMLDDCAARVLVTNSAIATQLPIHKAQLVCIDELRTSRDLVKVPNLMPVATPGHLAYMIYTSGSTGRPKGALNTHAAIVNRLLWMQKAYPLTASDVVLQKTPYAFDVSVWEFFWPLLAGAKLVVASPDGHKDPRYLARAIDEHGITTLHFVPSMLQAFIDIKPPLVGQSIRRLFCSGEALAPTLARAILQVLPHIRLHNLYGPTEAAVDVTYWDSPQNLGENANVPIGKPVDNTRIHILDACLQPVPIGVSGELYIAGDQVGQGYWQRPALTAERFIADPFSAPGKRMYRSGDMARWLADGNIEYLGRTDFQVKLRGLRIELGEIESALNGIAGLREAVVVANTDAGDTRLVAYAVLTDDVKPNVAAIRLHLAQRLPDYMIPADFVLLGRMPLNANGKLDRKQLPKVFRDNMESGGVMLKPPTSVTQAEIVNIFCEILRLEHLGILDNFFEVGGHSLLALRALEAIRSRLGIDIALRTFFEGPTPERLACFIENSRSFTQDKPQALTPNLVRLKEGHVKVNLVCVHPGGGGGLIEAYGPLIRSLEVAATIYGLNAVDFIQKTLPAATLQAVAASYVQQVVSLPYDEPYVLIGWSAGGLIALEMGRQLNALGRPPASLGLIDTHPLSRDTGVGGDWDEFMEFLGLIGWVDLALARTARSLSPDMIDLHRYEHILEFIRSGASSSNGITLKELTYLHEVFKTLAQGYAAYEVPIYTGPVQFFLPCEGEAASREFWKSHANGPLIFTEVNGDHYTMLNARNVAPITESLSECLRQLAYVSEEIV
ncbi:non-ribosomal peptide synthetase [Pseudomonas viridiflava]|uniref:non-ribosomal peptide synthetase n=1 Tax=Pseudomonas viridiflava TaxID=33069 RepID=UPI000F01F1B3|nr:non-ribosomal peptide synthetase [Pseudomonas viridiflava]